MKSEDTPNYEYWYCAMCRAPRTAQIKIHESVRRIEVLASEAKNLRINVPYINASFVTEVNSELKRMVTGSDLHSIRIGVGLGFGVPLDGSVEFDDPKEDVEIIFFNLRKHVDIDVDSKNRIEDIDANSSDFEENPRKHIENTFDSKGYAENAENVSNIRPSAETRKRKWITEPIEKKKRK